MMADKVLSAYISKYGAAPSLPDHLLKFSRSRADIPTLNYGSAKKAISDHQQQQKYESIKYGSKVKKSSSSKKYRAPNNKTNSRSSFEIGSTTSKRKSQSNKENDTVNVVVDIEDEKMDDNIELSTNDRLHKSIVIDNGTSLFKIGYVGDKKPVSMFHPTTISNGRILNTNPIQRGIIKDMYKIEDVYKHAFKNVLCLSDDELSDFGVICNCASFTPQQTAEELCELMMETFNVGRFFISAAPVLSLYAVQKVSGLVIESGGGLTQCVPIYNGCPCVPACKRIDVGGDDIDEYLFDLLKSGKYKNIPSIDMKICKQIKEKYGYIAIDYRKEHAKKVDFTLSDGSIIKIGDERFKCGELLFSYLSRNSVDKQIFDSIMNCDMDIRKKLFSNIIVSGGTMCMKGFKNRLNNELIQLCKNSKIKKTQKYAKKINITAHKNRDILSWLGGSIFGSLPAFKEMWFTKEQYQESGSLLSARIENNNIFFYDEYSPKEVDLKEIQNYNYRRRTISVYSHKNSITQYTTPSSTKSLATASNAYGNMSIGLKSKNKKNSLETNTIKIEPWNDNDNVSNQKKTNTLKIDNDEPWNDEDEGVNDFVDEINGQVITGKYAKRRKNSLKTELDARDETIQAFLLQIEELSLKNSELQNEVETLKQENKFYKHNEKKIESEKAKLQNLKNEIKLKSVQVKMELATIQQLFNNGNKRLQNLNMDFLSLDAHNNRANTKIEPIND